MPNIVLQVKKDVSTTLKEVGAPELSPALETMLDGQIRDLVNEDHKIRHLVSKYLSRFHVINSLTASVVYLLPELGEIVMKNYSLQIT